MKYQFLTRGSDILTVIESGPSGGTQSALVQYAQKKIGKISDVLSLQYARDEKAKDRDLVEYPLLTLDLYRAMFEKAASEINIQKYTKVFFVSHSYQAIVSLYLYEHMNVLRKKDVAFIFWDPSPKTNTVASIQSFFPLIGDIYYSNPKKKSQVSFSRKHIEQLNSFPADKAFSSFPGRISVITAFNAGEHVVGEYKKLKKKGVFYKTIRDCGHSFGNYRARKELLALTCSFIQGG